MAKKKTEEEVGAVESTEVVDAAVVAAPTEEVTEVGTASVEEGIDAAPAEETSEVAEPVVEAASAEEAAAAVEAPVVEEKPKKAAKAAAPKAKAKTKAPKKESAPAVEKGEKTRGKRAEKVGIVSSDKMEMTVTVRVDRLVKHPVYRKYVKKRKKFMAHDETGAKPGDKVRIVETRPMSARKRWRVVEILHKAAR